ncbi:hypothetical protein NIES806_45420 [Dolichospermum compactum NIES-806]|uniref:Uncharacterized protein n=1 Tax=Dolichospermum compactum NIES-806 TaxID=1973481 RepID=A0A1Z4VAP7_9CYAN|nr:hypothetical protein NIES806_45420 [Dolichospermum compactum NIES-806]
MGTWEGTVERETTIWGRFYGAAGNLVLLPEEAAKSQAEVAKSQGEAAKAKADRLAARLRELGEDPDML